MDAQIDDASAPARPTPGHGAKPAAHIADRDAVREHRVRQALSAEVIDAALGKFAAFDPDLWTRGAYMMVVGLLYDALMTRKKELPTSALLKLVQAFRAPRTSRKPVGRSSRNGAAEDAGAGPPTQPTGPHRLPPEFGDIVRQIYGANFHTERGVSGAPGTEGSKEASE